MKEVCGREGLKEEVQVRGFFGSMPAGQWISRAGSTASICDKMTVDG